MFRLAPLLAILCCLATPASAAPPDFPRDVYPTLKRRCFECHGPQKQEGDLRLDDRSSFPAGTEKTAELLRRVLLPTGDTEHMPANGGVLSQKEIDRLRAWIDAGAVWPESFTGGTHWAYVAPVRPALPVVANAGWPRGPIDTFVLARLESEGLTPSPEATRATLLRRVTLDLTGLPPTPAELDAFLADDSSDAYERVVDRLLASPAFGEKWARPWLDLARYADSHGFQRDDLRSLWPYRDWVIGALNANKPFDEFTIEQLAGDLLPSPTTDQLVATGFHRCTTTNVEAGTEPEETRVNQVLDRINTTATVWLGTTLECAQCHDHKYDPFTQRDYYALFAYFNNTELEADRSNPNVPGSIRFLGPSMPVPGEHAAPSAEDTAAALARIDRRLEAAKQRGDEKAAKTLAARRATLKKRTESTPPAPTTLIMRELPSPRPTFLFNRGVYTSPGEPVTAATPAALPPADGPSTRLTLARWLVSRDNPLTPRVVVNRWWTDLFGRGLVTTPEDFGLKGAPPTHPEVLDWLAVEFVHSGWDTKHVLREIVTSATYRQTSAVAEPKQTIEAANSPTPSSHLPHPYETDPDNALYTRGPRFRLDAETVRDQALAVAGLLSRRMYGPPVRPWQPEGLWAKVGGEAADKNYVVSPGEDAHRRGVYIVLRRSAPYPSFAAFDATPRLTCTVARSRSNTPLQALVLLNDPVYVEVAKTFALRIVTEATDHDTRLRHAIRLALGREATERDVEILGSLYDDQYASASTDPERARTLWEVLPQGVTPPEMAAWYAVATTLLNTDESVTRE